MFVGVEVCNNNTGCDGDNITQVAWNTATGAFQTVDAPHTLVASLLNNNTGLNLWDGSLCLKGVPSPLVVVVFGAPASTQVVGDVGVVFGQVVAQAEQQGAHNLTSFHLVDRATWTQPGLQQLVTTDMQVALCHQVVVAGVGAAGGALLLEHNTTMTTNPALTSLLTNTSLVVTCFKTQSEQQVDCLAPLECDVTMLVSLPEPLISSLEPSSSSTPPPTHQISIALDGSVVINATVDQIKQQVVQSLANQVAVVEVEVVVDEATNKVVKVVVVISGTDTQAQAVVDFIKQQGQAEHCAAGVLCSATDVFLAALTSAGLLPHLCTWLLLLPATMFLHLNTHPSKW